MYNAPYISIDTCSKKQERKKWLSYDPAMPLLGIQLEKTIIQRDTCTCKFTAAPFTIAKTWKQHKCPLTEQWKKKIWYIHTIEN